MKKTIAWLITLAFSALLALGIFYVNSRKITKIKPQLPTKVSTSLLTMREIPKILISYGHLIAPNRQQISAQVTGHIEKINYTPGQWVKQGTVLFYLRTATLDNKLESAKAALNFSQQKYHMYKQVYQVHAVAKVKYEQIKAQYLQDLAAYQQAQKQANYMQIKAPESGYVSASPFSVGSVIHDQDILTTLTPKSGYQIAYYIDEQWRPSLKNKQAVTIKFDSYPAITGIIDYLAPSATATHTYEVRASLAHSLSGIFPGMSAVITQTLTQQQEYVLPLKNVGNDADGFFIYEIKNNRLSKHYFTAKITTHNQIIMVKGLTPHTHYVSSNINELNEGEKVRV